MAGKKLQSAKKKKMINNTIVHIVLGSVGNYLAFPNCMGNSDELPCGKRLLRINLLPESIYA